MHILCQSAGLNISDCASWANAIGSFIAAVVALLVAVGGWLINQWTRTSDKREQEKLRRDDRLERDRLREMEKQEQRRQRDRETYNEVVRAFALAKLFVDRSKQNLEQLYSALSNRNETESSRLSFAFADMMQWAPADSRITLLSVAAFGAYVDARARAVEGITLAKTDIRSDYPHRASLAREALASTVTSLSTIDAEWKKVVEPA